MTPLSRGFARALYAVEVMILVFASVGRASGRALLVVLLGNLSDYLPKCATPAPTVLTAALQR